MSGTNGTKAPLLNTFNQTVSTINATETASIIVGLSPGTYYEIGALMAIVGNIVIAIALNVQKYAHRRQADQPEPTTRSLFGPGSYLRSGVWWIGISLMVLGEIGNFVAYGYAPASVVAPLGCIAVIANGILAVLFNNEVLRMQDIMGAAFAVVGGFLIVQFSGKSESILDAQQIIDHLKAWQFIIYMFVEIITFTTIIFLQSYDDHEDKSVTLQLLLVAILGSLTVISAKAVAGMLALSIQGNSQFTNAILYIMAAILAVTTILQVKYLNEAIAKFDIATVVPVNFVLFTISAIIAGAIFYQEFIDLSTIAIVMFMYGCFLSFIGVAFITSDKKGLEDEPASFHLDMMPNFIRSLAPSMRVMNVQPKTDATQSMLHFEDTRLLQPDKTVTRYDVGADKVVLPSLASDERSDNNNPTAEASNSKAKDLDDSDQDNMKEDAK